MMIPNDPPDHPQPNDSLYDIDDEPDDDQC
jgi:hypothetical protein